MEQRDWKPYIAKYQNSGLSKRAFAEANGLVYSQFLYWLCQSTSQEANPGKDFVSVTLPATTESEKGNGLGVLEFPNGSQLVIQNPELLNNYSSLWTSCESWPHWCASSGQT